MYEQEQRRISQMLLCLFASLIGLQVSRRKHVMRFFQKSSHYLDSQLSLSGAAAAAHNLIGCRSSLMVRVEIGLPGTIHIKRKRKQGGESVAINIISLRMLFEIFFFLFLTLSTENTLSRAFISFLSWAFPLQNMGL